MGLVVVVKHVGEVLAGDAEPVGMIVVAGGENDIAGLSRALAVRRPGGHAKRAAAQTLEPEKLLTQTDPEIEAVRHATVVA